MEPREHRESAPGDRNMGAAGSRFKQYKTAGPTAKGKRRKTPKPQSVCTSHDVAETTHKKRIKKTRQRPLGPGTQPGAHKRLPIVIDSDDDGPDARASPGMGAAFRYEFTETLSEPQVKLTPTVQIAFQTPP